MGIGNKEGLPPRWCNLPECERVEHTASLRESQWQRCFIGGRRKVEYVGRDVRLALWVAPNTTAEFAVNKG